MKMVDYVENSLVIYTNRFIEGYKHAFEQLNYYFSLENGENMIQTQNEAKLEILNQNPKITAYQQFFKHMDLDFKNNPPAVQNLISRCLAKGFFPTINPIVDAANVTSVKNLLPLAVFDRDGIDGNLKFTFAELGEDFTPIKGFKEPIRNEKLMVLRDNSKVVSISCYRDSDFTKITDKTKNLIVLSIVVDGVDEKEIDKTILEAEDLITGLE